MDRQVEGARRSGRSTTVLVCFVVGLILLNLIHLFDAEDHSNLTDPLDITIAVISVFICVFAVVWFRKEKMAEEALRASEEKYEKIFRMSPDVIAISDLGPGGVIDVNDAFESMTGYQRQEIMGRTLTDLGLLNDPSLRDKFLTQLQVSGSISNFPYTLRRRNGEQGQALVSGEIIMLGGRPQVLTIHRDITKEKKVEAELHRLNRALRTIVTCRQTMAQAKNELELLKEICTVLVNDGGYRMVWVGFTEDDEDKSVRPVAFAGHEDGYLELVKITYADAERGHGPTGTAVRTGKSCIGWDLAEDIQFSPWREEALKRGYASSISLPLMHEGGAFGAFTLYSNVPGAFDPEEVRLLSELTQDLAYGIHAMRMAAERDRAESALRESEAQLRSFIEHSPYGIFRVNLKEDRFLKVNPALMEMLGYDTEIDVLDLRLSRDVYAKESEIIDLRKRLHQTGTYKLPEMEWRRKNGESITVRLGLRVGVDTSTDICEGVVEDISDYRTLEEKFRQAQKMEAIGLLAGGVAHDFNNLLGIIMGYSELALLDRTLSPKTKQRLQEINQASLRAKDVTTQLLAFSRKQVLQTKTVDLNEIVQGNAKMLGRLLGEDIELSISSATGIGSVHVDPTGVDQIIMNLAVNARDAMPNGGKLKIETRNITADQAYSEQHGGMPPGNYVMLGVTDTGMGMDHATQKHIFEPFFTTKGKDQGTGLGLSTVYGIVTQSGGYIWLESEIGVGTRFNVYFPRVEGSATVADDVRISVIERGSEAILLVEDDAALRELDRELLEEMGYQVYEAGNAEEAIAVAERCDRQLDLLMSDVVMPGMNGKDLAEKLVASRPTLKILYVSGYCDKAILESILSSGEAYLQKPLSRYVLSRKLREIFDATT